MARLSLQPTIQINSELAGAGLAVWTQMASPIGMLSEKNRPPSEAMSVMEGERARTLFQDLQT